MKTREHTKIQKRLQALHQQMGKLGPVMRGSLVFIGNQKKYSHFSLNKDQKTQLIYLGKKREAKAREYSENYKKLLDIIEEMTTLNMTLLKEDEPL